MKRLFLSLAFLLPVLALAQAPAPPVPTPTPAPTPAPKPKPVPDVVVDVEADPVLPNNPDSLTTMVGEPIQFVVTEKANKKLNTQEAWNPVLKPKVIFNEFKERGTKRTFFFQSPYPGEFAVFFWYPDQTAGKYTYITVLSPLPPPPPIPPGPGPNPGPGPTPNPGKVMGKAGFVVVIEETSDLAASRRLTFADTALSNYMAQQGHKWRIVDKDVRKSLTDPTPPEDVARFLNEAKGKGYPQVFLVDTGGNEVTTAPLPSGDGAAAALLDLIKKNGG